MNYELRTQNYKAKGFTLIELLIVITIAGILAAVVARTYGGSQQRARDAIRKNDLAQIKRALELAKQDCQGTSWYPVVTGANEAARFTTLRTYLSDTDLKYMPSVPNDPKNVSPYVYRYNTWTSGGTFLVEVCLDTSALKTQDGSSDYMLRALLERGESDPESASSFTKCTGKPGMPGSAGGYFYVCNE